MRPVHRALLLLLALAGSLATSRRPLAAQSYAAAIEGRHAPDAPRVRYTVRIDPRDLDGYDVEMTVRDAPDTLRLQLPIWAPGAYRVANFHRNIRDVSVRSGGQAIPVTREDSSTWRAIVPHGAESMIRYRMRFPSARAARAPNNRSFLTATGGLLDGPQTYMYVAGHEDAPAHVRFVLPAGWRIATGLVPTSDAATFFAPSYDVLIDSPVMVGRFRLWRFDVDGIPHRIAFWTQPGAPAFDSTRFVESARRGVEEARNVMRDLPYREYTFLYVDGAGGGLEHLNSTTIGVSAARLAKDPLAALSVTIHEFFHLWNVKRVRPVALGPFDYQHQVRSKELWWSEGVTDYFAAEIARRTGLLTEAQARAELEDEIRSYIANPAAGALSPERTSETAWDTPAVNQGLSLSYYLQGRLLGEILELRLRSETGLARGMDDVMRTLYAKYAGERGFTGEELYQAVAGTCGCDLKVFWDVFITKGAPLNFDQGLDPLGMQILARQVSAMTPDGHAAGDLRIGVMTQAGYGSAGGAAGGRLRLSVGSPRSVWGAAGLLTGDELVAFRGRAVTDPEEFRALLRQVRIGDTVRVDVLRSGSPVTAFVPVVGYDEVVMHLVDFPVLTERQRAMRRIWMTGRP